jgi:hypothetical protein
MRFKMDGRNYDVTFRYVDVRSKNSETPVRETHCIISEYHPDETDRDKRFVELSKGVAVQNPKDAFVRAVGRRKSLTKALSTGKTTKEQRTYIWDMYFNNHSDFWDGCSDKRIFDSIVNFSDLKLKGSRVVDAR